MNDEAFQALIEKSVAELEFRTQSHQAIWRLGEEEEWLLDQDEGRIYFVFANNRVVSADVQIVATFDSVDGTWMWAWGNPSVEKHLTQDSIKVRDFGVEKGIDLLQERKFSCSEDNTWALAALSMHLCKRHGVYRGPDGSTHIFFTFGKYRIQELPDGWENRSYE